MHQSGLTPGAAGSVARKDVLGANWSAAIGNPFRTFGTMGEGLESTLAQVRANANWRILFGSANPSRSAMSRSRAEEGEKITAGRQLGWRTVEPRHGPATKKGDAEATNFDVAPLPVVCGRPEFKSS